MEGYDYRCPGCDRIEIVFKKIKGRNVFFYCRTCGKDFFTPDQESGYIHKKVLFLKRRYPDQLKERNNRVGGFRGKRRFL